MYLVKIVDKNPKIESIKTVSRNNFTFLNYYSYNT